MNRGVPTSDSKDHEDVARWIQAAALRMESDKEFCELILLAIERIVATGLNFQALSLYLFAADSKIDALHYSVFHGKVSWMEAYVDDSLAEFYVHENKVVQSWRETQSEGVFVYLCIPSTTGYGDDNGAANESIYGGGAGHITISSPCVGDLGCSPPRSRQLSEGQRVLFAGARKTDCQ